MPVVITLATPGQQLLQLRVLVFQRLQALGVRYRHAAILGLPGIKDPLEHPVLAAQIRALRSRLLLAKDAGPRRSGRQLTPLGQGGGAVPSEDVAAIEVTVLIEMIMDRGVDGGKLLQSFYVPELRHRTFSSSERLK